MDKHKTEAIQAILEEQVRQEVFPGANVAIVFQGKTSLFTCGKKSLLPRDEANDFDTIYDLASLTKVIATTNLIMQLVDEKVLVLDQTVHSILPQFIHEDITIRDLLVHRSGLPADILLRLDDTKTEIFRGCMNCPKKYPTGSSILYSDIGFMILGFLLEERLGVTLDKAFYNRICKPLEMMNTGYNPSESLCQYCAPTEISPHFHKLIRGQVHDRKAYLMGGISAHAGVFSTISDMGHMLEMLLGRGMYKGSKILSHEAIQGFVTCYSPVGEIRRGIGYLLKDERSPFASLNTEHAMLHTGFSGTSLLVDFDLEVGIVILSNRIHPTRANTKILEARKRMHEQIIHVLLK